MLINIVYLFSFTLHGSRRLSTLAVVLFSLTCVRDASLVGSDKRRKTVGLWTRGLRSSKNICEKSASLIDPVRHLSEFPPPDCVSVGNGLFPNQWCGRLLVHRARSAYAVWLGASDRPTGRPSQLLTPPPYLLAFVIERNFICVFSE